MQLPPPIHGVTITNQVVARSTYLRERFDLQIVPLRFAHSIDDLGHVSARKLARGAVTGARLAWSLLARRPDSVYFTLAPRGAAFARDCVYVAIIKAFGVRRIYHLHAQGVASELTSRAKRAVYAWVFRDAWVIQLSPTLDQDVAAVVADDHVLHVANGIADRTAPRVDAEAAPRVLFLSHMIEEKGPLVLLAALADLHARGVAFEATFAGARSADGCAERLEAAIVKLGLGDRVRYVGPVYGEAKDQLFATHDVFCCPTYRDAFPLVLLEAMQHGLAIVATREGAIPEIVEDGVAGLVIPKRDVAALTSALARLLEDRMLRAAMGKRGRARYLQRYTLERFERDLGAALDVAVRAP